MTDEQRLKIVYKRSRELGLNPPLQTFEYDKHKYAFERYSQLPSWEKIARATADAIVNQEVYIEPFDKIIGRVYHTNSKPIDIFDKDFDRDAMCSFWREKHPEYQELCDYKMASWGGVGHVAWNWNVILNIGTEGLRQQCSDQLLRHRGDEKAEQFYNGVIIMLEAMGAWSDKHLVMLEKMGKIEEAEIVRRVPRKPATSFREAVQSFFMQHIVVMKESPFGGNSPGRLDYYLWPYLERDLEEGKCTLDEARYLIEELFIRIDERIHSLDTWAETIVVGGSYPNGQSAVNPLTYVMVEAYKKYDLTHPSVYHRVPAFASKEYMRACADFVINGGNRAQIINDKAIISALVKHGVSFADACDYYCGGCMEIGIQGRTSDLLFTGKHSIAQILELCMTGGYSLVKKEQLKYFKTKPLYEYDDFESFYTDFINETKRILSLHLQCMDVLSECAEYTRPSYLISAMTDDCISKGRNMHGGGARYHDYGATFMGLPNVADSLLAIKKAVFEEKICTAAQLLDALRADFEGFEELRARLLKLPKYGQENAEADEMMSRLTSDVCKFYVSYKNRFGGYGKPVILSFTYAPEVGKLLGATPDGRKAGVPVAQAITPQSVAMAKGITVAMNSCTSLDFDLFPGGATTMWDLDPSWASPEIVEWLITAFFERGGQFFQGNVNDAETLIEAQKNPEQYPNLIVRVGGYSARFTWLGKDLQNDIINRMRHKG